MTRRWKAIPSRTIIPVPDGVTACSSNMQHNSPPSYVRPKQAKTVSVPSELRVPGLAPRSTRTRNICQSNRRRQRPTNYGDPPTIATRHKDASDKPWEKPQEEQTEEKFKRTMVRVHHHKGDTSRMPHPMQVFCRKKTKKTWWTEGIDPFGPPR